MAEDIIARLRERYRQDSSVADEGTVLMSGITQRDVDRLQAFVVKHELHTGIGVTDFKRGKPRNIVFLGPTADDRAKFWAAVEKEPDVQKVHGFTYDSDEARLFRIYELLGRDIDYIVHQKASEWFDGIWPRSFMVVNFKKEEDSAELLMLLQQHCADINAQKRERGHLYEMTVSLTGNGFIIENCDNALTDILMNRYIRQLSKESFHYIQNIRIDPENKDHFSLETLPGDRYAKVNWLLCVCNAYTNAKREGTGEPEMSYEHSSRSVGGEVFEVFNPAPVLRKILEERMREQGRGPAR